MNKRRSFGTMTNAVDPATTANKDWGFIPVPCKGGKTTNFGIPESLFKRELEEYLKGGAIDA